MVILNKRQEKLMQLMWDMDRPLSVNEMAELLASDGWTRITIFKTVQALNDSGYIEVSGMERSNTQYSRVFVPRVSRDEYGIELLKARGYGANDVARMAVAMLGDDDGNEKKGHTTIKELKRLIEELSN